MTDNTTTVDMNNQPTTTTNTNNNISTTTHNNNSISLKRNQSISSSTSSKVGTHDGAPPQQHSHQPLTNSTTFPASPALSTLTKNTSSSDSCSSAHVHSSAFGAGGSNSRMNVDDILNKSKFKGKRRGRRKSSLGVKTVNGGGVGGVRVSKPAAKKLIGVPSNNYHQKVKANNTKVHNKQDGQNERKMRLQRLQQEQLLKQKRKLTSMGSSSGGGSSVLKRQSSLDSRTSLDREMENTQEIERSEEKSVSSRSSSRSSSSNRKKRAAETTSGSSISESIPQQRRSKRAKSSIPTSYNVTELTKQNSIMSEIEVKKSSSSVVAVAAGSSQVESAEAQSNEELAEGKDKNIPKEDETQEEEEEPDSVQSALSTLLTKYNSCIGLPSSTIPLSSTKTLPSTAKAATTWEIVQLLVSTLRYINLLDPKSVNTEEYKEVVNGLSNVLKSVSCVKLLVMNRTSVVQGEAKANGDNEQGNGDNQEEDDEDSITKITNYNTKLLSNIQLQIWMRMMIWSLEEVAGWEFLCQIVSLADTKLIQQQGVDGGDKGGKGKKKKKKKGKKQQKKTTKEKDMSPRDNLVQDIRQLMELAPYVLPPSMEFAQWLKDTLTLGFRQSIPEYGVELFDHFEIELAAAEPIVLKRSDTDTSRRSERSHVSHSPVKDNTTTKGGVTGSNSSASPTKNITEKRHKRQQAYFASLAEEENKASAASGSSSIKTDDETATITGSVSTVTSTSRASSKSVREKDDNILLKTSVSLTSTIPSRTSNPFLKGSARGSYVGSHLSSKLSNITSLFREVKAAPKTKPKAKAPQAASKKAPPTQQAAIAGIKRKNSLPKQLSVTSVKPATTTTTRFKATITEESTVSSVPNEPQSKRRRPAVSSLRASSYTARATANPRAASSSFTVGETPMKRPIIEETPAKNPQPGAVRQRLRLRDDRPYMGNAIVAETPQQPLMRGGSSSGGQEDSSFLPTNLWSRQYQHSSGTRRPPQRAGWIDTRHRQQQQNGNNNSHLSPVVNLGASGSMNLGFSPMPHQEDMASALAKAAKSAASRKRK